MEPEGLKPHSQEHSTCPYSETNPVHTTPSYPYMIHLNIIHPPSCPSGPSGLFRTGFSTSKLDTFLSSSFARQAPPTSSSYTW
jgi:hypothetical protein